MVYDTGVPQSLGPTASAPAFDSSSDQPHYTDVPGAVTTFTYVDSRYGGLDNCLAATNSEATVGRSLESRMISKLLLLLQFAPQSGQPLWWHIWKAVAEDPWFRSQQLAIGRRLVQQPEAIEEMCQVSTVRLGRLLERSPSLGLPLDEFASKFPRWVRRIIRTDFITWLRLRSIDHRRYTAWPTTDFAVVGGMPLLDELEIADAMAELPALHRDVVEMRSVGYKRKDIARVLNISIYQVDRIYRSCQGNLRRRLRASQPECLLAENTNGEPGAFGEHEACRPNETGESEKKLR